MRDLIKERFPEHGIFGEEFGMQQPSGDSGFLWVLDPIDGTKSFITGMFTQPHKSTQAIRCHNDNDNQNVCQPGLGACGASPSLCAVMSGYNPSMQRLCWA